MAVPPVSKTKVRYVRPQKSMGQQAFADSRSQESGQASAGSRAHQPTGLLDRLGQTANTPLTFDNAPPIREQNDHPAFYQPGRRARR